MILEKGLKSGLFTGFN